MSERKRILVAVFLVLFALAAHAGDAGKAKDPKSPNFVWKVTQQVFNETPYRMKVLSKTLTEGTYWGTEPKNTLEPGDKDVHDFSNGIPGHGLVGHVVYGAYDKTTDAFKGMVIARSGIDCNGRTAYTCLPTMYHRWEGLVCDSNGAVKGRWYDNAGDPENFWTGIHLLANGGACMPGLTAPAGEPKAPDPNLPVPWRVSANVDNRTPLLFKLRNVWNSEGTHFNDFPPPLTIFPPAEIKPGQKIQLAWSYVNLEKLHGPSAIIMYDAFDPDAGNKYVGSMTFEAAVDCGPAWTIDEGCLGFESWSRDSAGAIPGYELKGIAESTGLPPLNFMVDNTIIARRTP